LKNIRFSEKAKYTVINYKRKNKIFIENIFYISYRFTNNCLKSNISVTYEEWFIIIYKICP